MPPSLRSTLYLGGIQRTDDLDNPLLFHSKSAAEEEHKKSGHLQVYAPFRKFRTMAFLAKAALLLLAATVPQSE